MLAKFLICGFSFLSLVANCKSECDCNALKLIRYLCQCVSTETGQCQVICDKKSTLTKEDALNIAKTLPDKDVNRLYLANCEFAEFPDKFLDGKNVEDLLIWTSHALQRIGETAFAVNAKRIDLDYLFELMTINSKAFTQMKELVSLNIRGCPKLTTADFDFSKNPNLLRIVVHTTAIKTMKRPILNKRSEAKEIQLQLANNNLICDCEMIWVMEEPWWSMVDCVKPPRIFGRNPLTIVDFEHCDEDDVKQGTTLLVRDNKLLMLCVYAIYSLFW